MHRHHHARRIPPVYREGHRPEPPLPKGAHRTRHPRGDDGDFDEHTRQIRAAPHGAIQRRGVAGLRRPHGALCQRPAAARQGHRRARRSRRPRAYQQYAGARGDYHPRGGAGACGGEEEGGVDREALQRSRRVARPRTRPRGQAGRHETPLGSRRARPSHTGDAAGCGRRGGHDDRRTGGAHRRERAGTFAEYGERTEGQRRGSGRSHRPDSKGHPSQPRRIERPEPPHRKFPLPRSHRRGQDLPHQDSSQIPVRQRSGNDTHRHERIYGEIRREPPHRSASGICGLRGGRPVDRARAPQALQHRAARRGGESASRRVQRAAAGARRRPADRRHRPQGGLQEHHHHHDLEHRQSPAERLRRGRGLQHQRPRGRERRHAARRD